MNNRESLTLEEARQELAQLRELYPACTGGKVSECRNSVGGIVRVRNYFQTHEYGLWNYCHYCKACGRKSSPISNPRGDQTYHATDYDPKEAQRAKDSRANMGKWMGKLATYVSQADAAMREDERRAEYENYIHSPKWREKRRQVMERCGGVCEGCKIKKAVQVHHLTYDNFGDELLFQLVGVCADCHGKCHPWKNQEEAS